MNAQPDADVVVVGGGPAGLAAAVGVALMGRTAIVVDSGGDRGPGGRAVMMHSGTLRVLSTMGCADAIVAEAATIDSMETRTPRHVLTTARFTALPGPYPFAVTLLQARTEAILRARAQELGVRLVTDRAMGVVQDHRGSAALLEGGASLGGRYLVGADGMHGTVRRAAGISYPDTGASSGDAENLTLADVVAPGYELRDRAIILTGPGGMLALVPLPQGRLRVVANLPEGHTAPTADSIQSLIDTRWSPRRSDRPQISVDEVVASTHLRIRHHLADRFRANRVLLAGDAGHVHSTAGGQGMNLGIRDGWYLARAIAGALDAEEAAQPDKADALLDSYASNRRAVAARVIDVTNRISRIMFPPAPFRPLVYLGVRLAERFGAGERQALALSGLLDTGPDMLRSSSQHLLAEPSGQRGLA
ncbi:FAD-dependent monooxygenase [Sinomonas sp. P10A9]|uniref:FAD-dependent monooxygenase n=1 Tax=Sinomonas puerhi TaxID=3238584 RepID=A0AB39L2T5_9MICC